MKRTHLILLLLSCFSFLTFLPVNSVALTSEMKIAQNREPAYAKWGRLAMQETKKKYPNANIIDYQHLGRAKNPKTSVEKFKLWLKDDHKEFGVIVTIVFDTKTQKLKEISFQETSR